MCDEPMSRYAFNTYKSNIVKVYILKRHYIWQIGDLIFKKYLDNIKKTIKGWDKTVHMKLLHIRV